MRLLYLIVFCLLTDEFFNSLKVQQVKTLSIDPTETVELRDAVKSVKDKMGIEKVENWSALDFDRQEMEETPYLLMFRFK